MHADPRNLLQQHFSMVYAYGVGAWLLFLNNESFTERIDDRVLDVSRRNAGDRPD
jgi:hypothetical protein